MVFVGKFFCAANKFSLHIFASLLPLGIMKTLASYTVDFPQWALCQLINGGDSPLSDEEIEMVADFEREWNETAKNMGGHVVFSPTGETSEFCRFPEIGLAGPTEKLEIVILGK